MEGGPSGAQHSIEENFQGVKFWWIALNLGVNRRNLILVSTKSTKIITPQKVSSLWYCMTFSYSQEPVCTFLRSYPVYAPFINQQ